MAALSNGMAAVSIGMAAASHGMEALSYGTLAACHGTEATLHGTATRSHVMAVPPYCMAALSHGIDLMRHGMAPLPHGKASPSHGKAEVPHGRTKTLREWRARCDASAAQREAWRAIGWLVSLQTFRDEDQIQWCYVTVLASVHNMMTNILHAPFLVLLFILASIQGNAQVSACPCEFKIDTAGTKFTERTRLSRFKYVGLKQREADKYYEQSRFMRGMFVSPTSAWYAEHAPCGTKKHCVSHIQFYPDTLVAALQEWVTMIIELKPRQ